MTCPFFIFGGFTTTSPLRSIAQGEFPSRGFFAGTPEAIVVGFPASGTVPTFNLEDAVLRNIVKNAFAVRRFADGNVFVHGIEANADQLSCEAQ